MGWRIRRSIKIAPGVKLNMSKSGFSTSIGGRGSTVNFGHGRVKTTVGIPGSGISYSKQSGSGRGRSSGYSGGGCFLTSLFALPVYIFKFLWIILRTFFSVLFILISMPLKAIVRSFRELKTTPFSEQKFSSKLTILLTLGFIAGSMFLIPTALIGNAIHPIPTATATLTPVPTHIPTITFTPKPTQTAIPTVTLTPTSVPTETLIPTEAATIIPVATTINRSGLIPVSTSTSAPAVNNTGNTSWPNGATAQCKDGSYWYAIAHRGACSHHGGVLIWK